MSKDVYRLNVRFDLTKSQEREAAAYLNQLNDMFPQICLSLVMGAIVYSVRFLQFNDIITLLIQIPIGVMIYWSMSKIFHVESYEYLLDTVRGFLYKRKKHSAAP